MKAFVATWGSMVLFKVLEQHRRGFKSFTASNGWTIVSDLNPGLQLSTKTICVRGRNKANDSRPVYASACSWNLAEEDAYAIRAAIREFDDSAGPDPLNAGDLFRGSLVSSR